MIRCEEEILGLKTRFPERFAQNMTTAAASSPLHWRGRLSGLVELVCALDYSGHITDALGGKPSFAAIVSAFQELFNVTIDKPYDQRARLAARKRRLSVLLPELKAAFEKNVIHCGIDRE